MSCVGHTLMDANDQFPSKLFCTVSSDIRYLPVYNTIFCLFRYNSIYSQVTVMHSDASWIV